MSVNVAKRIRTFQGPILAINPGCRAPNTYIQLGWSLFHKLRDDVRSGGDGPRDYEVPRAVHVRSQTVRRQIYSGDCVCEESHSLRVPLRDQLRMDVVGVRADCDILSHLSSHHSLRTLLYDHEARC